MRITNSTNWSTADLRRVFSPVLAAWNKRHASMPRRVVNSKRLGARPSDATNKKPR